MEKVTLTFEHSHWQMTPNLFVQIPDPGSQEIPARYFPNCWLCGIPTRAAAHTEGVQTFRDERSECIGWIPSKTFVIHSSILLLSWRTQHKCEHHALQLNFFCMQVNALKQIVAYHERMVADEPGRPDKITTPCEWPYMVWNSNNEQQLNSLHFTQIAALKHVLVFNTLVTFLEQRLATMLNLVSTTFIPEPAAGFLQGMKESACRNYTVKEIEGFSRSLKVALQMESPAAERVRNSQSVWNVL